MLLVLFWQETLQALMWLPGGNNVLGSRPKAELSLVMDLPATVGINFLAQGGMMFLQGRYMNKVRKGACGINEDLEQKKLIVDPI